VLEQVVTTSRLVIAREYGFASWPKLKAHVDSLVPATGDPVNQLTGLT